MRNVVKWLVPMLISIGNIWIFLFRRLKFVKKIALKFMDKHKILIIGTGMMGTSLANALIAKDFHEVFTFESMGNQSHAKRYVDGTWHQVYVDGIFKTVDIIVFATPRHVVNEFVAGKAYLFKKDVVITDISSAKGTLTKDINDILMRGQKKAGKVFVSSHPMCGSEKKGAVFADYKIFEDRNCIMISDVDIEEAPYSTYMIKHMWEHLGMRVSFVKSDYIHDVITASVSHIPHIVAMAM